MSRRWLLPSLIGVVILIGLGATAVVLLPHSATPPAIHGKTLTKAGSSFGIALGQASTLACFLNASSRISGSFVTTQGVVLAALSEAAYLQYFRSGNLSGAQYQTGNLSAGTWDFLLPAGSWTLLFYPTGQIWGTTVQFTSDLIAAPG